MAVASDNFNRADENPLAGNWSSWDTSAKLLSNSVTPIALGGDMNAVWKTAVTDFTDDHYSEAALTETGGASTGGPGVLVRSNGLTSHNAYRVVSVSGSNGTVLAKFVAGTYTQLALFSKTWSAGAVMRVSVIGTLIEIFFDGVSIGTFTDSAVTTGQPGIAYSSTSTTASLDLWAAGDLPAYEYAPVFQPFVPMSRRV